MKKLTLIILTFSINCSLSSQTHNWTRTNPGGGGAYSTIGASASGIIIAGSDLSGAYRSENGGQTWDVIGVSNGLSTAHISGVGFHRTNGNILYLGTNDGLFRSDNGGDTVTKVLDGGYTTDIEFGTDKPTIGYAAYHSEDDVNDGAIYKSTNNGISWSQSSINIPNGNRILKIIVNPTNVNVLYILTGMGRFACSDANVYRSTDGGINWVNLTSSLSEILDVAIDSSNPNHIYITTMNAPICPVKPNDPYWINLLGNLYKSSDGGVTWGAPLSDYTGVIWLDKNASNTIRLIDPREPYPWIGRSGTFTSTDGGLTFTQTGNVKNWGVFFDHNLFWSYGISYNGISKTLGEDLSNDSNYFWINSQWVFSTTDKGKTFNNIFTDEVSSGFWQSRGFDNVNMMDISISEVNPNIIYTANFDIGIQRSLDKGKSWQNCNDSPHTGGPTGWDGFGGNSATVLADPKRANVVWASLGGQQNGQSPTFLLKNTKTGNKNNWVDVSAGLPNEEIMGLSIDKKSPENNRTLYVTALKDVYKSTNDGNSWVKVLDCNGCRFTAVDQFNKNIVYAGGEKGFWRSMNGGSNWTDVSDSQMKTSGGFNFWDSDYSGVFDIKTDPNNKNWVYVTALGNNKGLFRSKNNGTTWTKILTDNFMRKVAIVPQNSNVIYATSSSAFEDGYYNSKSNGIWFSDKGGKEGSWVQQNKGMAFPYALAVAIDYTPTPTVFVGSPGTGFQKSSVPLASLPVEEFENAQLNIKIYPNPFQDKLHIDYANEKYSGKIINSLGQELATFSNVTSSISLKLNKLQAGIYFVQIFDITKRHLNTYKVMKL